MPTTQTRHWAPLAVIALAQFMVIMDTSIIGVALPEIQADIGFSSSSLSWVFNAYVIAFGGLLLLGGRLTDLFGARRIFSLGWGVLAAGSLAAGLANSTTIEIAARAVQGAGAALIAPSALTLLIMIFGSNPRELTKAFAVYGAAAPAGGTAGVFLGGVLTEWTSWPWVFYINIPIALVALTLTPRLMPGAPARRGSVDVLGATTATAGLTLLVLGIVRAPVHGWASGSTLLTLLAGVVLLATFALMQARRREPLMRLGILRTPNLAAANGVQFLLGAAWIPTWFFLNLYLQQVLGYGPFDGGAALLPMTIAIMVLMVGVAPRVIARFGPKLPIVAGMVLLAGGMASLARVQPDGSFATDILPASLIAADRHGAGVHPITRHGDLRRSARRRRPRRRHRQHLLPGRIRPRPGRHDRRREFLRSRPDRRPRPPHRRLLSSLHRRRRRRRSRSGARVRDAALPRRHCRRRPRPATHASPPSHKPDVQA